MIKTKIKWAGKKVTLRGFGFGRYQHLKMAQVGLRSMRRRLQKGLGAYDTPMPKLSENYRKWKRGQKIRDLWLTGKMLLNLSVRWASDRQANVATSSRIDRLKAQQNQKIAWWLAWSVNDQKAIMDEGRKLFKAELTQVEDALVRGRPYRSGGRKQFQRDSSQFRRAS